MQASPLVAPNVLPTGAVAELSLAIPGTAAIERTIAGYNCEGLDASKSRTSIPSDRRCVGGEPKGGSSQ